MPTVLTLVGILPEHVRNEVCEKGYRNKPLTKEQKENTAENPRFVVVSITFSAL